MIMTLTRKGYKARIMDKKIGELLRVFGAVSIEAFGGLNALLTMPTPQSDWKVSSAILCRLT
jgi:hypothetical protein